MASDSDSNSDSDSQDDVSDIAGLGPQRLPPKKVAVGKIVIDSPSAEDDEEEATASPKISIAKSKPTVKAKPKPRAAPAPARAPSSRLANEGHAVSAKKKEMDKEADKKKIALLEKKLAKANKLASSRNDVAQTSKNPDPPRDSGPESEDPEYEETLAFSSSITALPTVSASKVKASQAMRRVPANSAASKSSVSRRTFLQVAVPDEPRSSSPVPFADAFLPSSPTQERYSTTTNGDETTTTDQQSKDRKRRASTSISAPSAPFLKKKKSHTLLPASFWNSYVDGGGRPKSSDYVDVVEALLLRSMREYEALISAVDAFPSGAPQLQWVRLCWLNTAVATDEHYEISDRMGQLIKKRGSRTRGDTLTHVRSPIVTMYQFNWKTTPKGVVKNVLRSAELLAGGAYHYKDTVLCTGYAQHHIVSEIIHLAFFGHSTSIGIVYSWLFDPISLSTLALIFTLLEHCLKEWSTGRYIRADITEKELKVAYRVHEIDLLAWQNVNVPVVENIRKKLYNRARRNAGVPEDLEPITRIVGDVKQRLRNELEGRTGETDSEMSVSA